jgi:protein-S-isoprenylcysteine O-methyltransferase Ste14
MSENNAGEHPEPRAESAPGITWKAALRFGIYLLMLPLVLFLAAGRLDWTMGWVYVGLSFFFTAVSRGIALRKNPDLLVERGRSLEAEDVKSWDRALVGLVALYGPLVTLVVAGLQQRFGWEPRISLTLQLIALALVVLSYLVSTWAMAVNRFFSAFVRIQKDRGQTVVTDGPYRWVRHPAYAASIPAFLATPVMLDAFWALIPAVPVVVGTVVRTALEDRTLQEELEGYAAYAQRVRYRLLPGVW